MPPSRWSTQSQSVVSPNDRVALRWGVGFGIFVIVLLALLGTEFQAPLATGRPSWLLRVIPYFNKEAAIPVGVVTVVLLAMLHYDRKPKSDWTLLLGGTFITFLAGFVDAGFMNLKWPLGLASALLIISPCIVYIIVYNCLRLWERIMAIFP